MIYRLFLLTLLLLPVAGLTQTPPCAPCAGLSFDAPEQLTNDFFRALGAEPRLHDEEIGDQARLYISWPADLDILRVGSLDQQSAQVGELAQQVRDAGGVPWLRLIFRVPAPVLDNADQLDAALKATASLAEAAGERTHFQVVWQPVTAGIPLTALEDWSREYAFLLKRASVAITGARADARVLTQALPADPNLIDALYAEEIAAYIDGVALLPGETPEGSRAAIARVAVLDAGRAVVLDQLPTPADNPWHVLVRAADSHEQGFALTFFGAGESVESPEGVEPFKVLAREFQGDIALDPYSRPEGGRGAWSFVRGDDLSLRIIVDVPADTEELTVQFPDSQLKRPARWDAASNSFYDLFSQRRTDDGLQLTVPEPGHVALLRLERMTAAEIEGLEGVESEITVSDERQMPVEEILRRLQAFDDNQARRLQRYRALNTTHMRFQLSGTGPGSVEATFEGSFFFQRGEGFDWAWENFYFDGVRWRGDDIPQIPLVQPEKAAAPPLEINFTKEYLYRLRGTDIVDGRDSWVVDFEPAVEVEPGRTLYQGTVWVDRQHFGRVRTRALQLGLEGEVLSNEETTFFTPVTPAGEPTTWTPEALWMPLRQTSQQLLNVLNSTVVVETETLLSALQINPEDFERQRQEVLASDTTMVRDTDQGLRYLVKDDETGERVVQDGFKKDQLFALGGVFYDESFDFPLPLAGVNYFSFDFLGTGAQANLLFGGVLAIGNIADPDLFGSEWDAGASIFALAIAGSDTLFFEDEEIEEQEIENRQARFSLFLGRPLGEFGKIDFTYSLRVNNYSDADDTAAGFVLPEDHLLHTFQVDLAYNRSGYRFLTSGSYNQRSDWQPWGLPGSPIPGAALEDFDPETEDFVKWNVSLGKTWWLPNFRKFGVSLQYLDGQDLDRFSKYQFGFFGDSRINGYQSDRVRAERAYGMNLEYGVEIGEVFRLEIEADGFLATDEASGLEDEFLAGIGLGGTVLGPWETIINLEVGKAVAGPDDGVSAFITFLKLFDWKW